MPAVIADKHTAIHIYRPGASAGVMANAMYTPQIQIDTQAPRPIKSGEMISMQLPAGSRQIRLLGDYVRDSEQGLVLTTSAGRHYYLRVNSVLALPETSDYQPWRREFSLSPVAADQARAEIDACCYQADKRPRGKENETDARGLDGAAQQLEESQGDGGFSIEKTANPFSHDK